MTTQRRLREPWIQGPFTREEGGRYWICRMDFRHRIRLPNELMEELGWRSGDLLELEVLEAEHEWAIRVTNPTALARIPTEKSRTDWSTTR